MEPQEAGEETVVEDNEGVYEWWSLTDHELAEKLAEVSETPPKEEIREISVHGYQNETLTYLPFLENVPHLNMLTVIDLRWNRIKEIQADFLPVTLEALLLCHNDIQSIPALMRLSKLKELHVSKNQVVSLDPHIPNSIEIIDLSTNNIQAIPPLENHHKLRQLFLTYNYIYHISSNQLPSNLETLDLSHNYISAPLHLDQLTSLKHCDLSYNKLRQLHSHFPPQLEVLNVSYNNIQNVPSMENTKLKYLDFTDNIVVRLQGLPSSLEVLKLSQVTTLKVMTEECFPTEAVYNVIKKSLSFSQVFQLAQPAPHVFMQGYQHVKRYFNCKLNCNSRNRIVFLGEPESGKTSLARTLVKGRPILTHFHERTNFMKITTWKVDEENSFRIYDHSGNDAGSIINHLFSSNKSIVFICHDLSIINKLNCMQSIGYLSRAVQRQPVNHIHFVVTHTDKLYTQSYFESLNLLKKAVSQFWNETAEELKRQENNSNKKDIHNLLVLYKQKKEALRYFPVSCKTNKGIPEFKDFLIRSTDEHRVLIPDYWLEVYSSLKQTPSSVLTFGQVKQSLKEDNTDDETVTGKVEDCMRYFNDMDIVVWRHEELPQYIFHNLGFLIDIFSSVFQSNLPQFLKQCFEEDVSFQELVTEDNIQNMITLYNDGLLRKDMIVFLWKSHELPMEVINALLEVMKSFCLLQPISDQTADALLYCPWMVTNIILPDDLFLNQPIKIDYDHVSLHLELNFHNGLPDNLCMMMFICLQRLAVNNLYNGQRYSWTDGLVVVIGHCRAIVFRDKINSTLSCVIQTSVEEISKAWELLSVLHKDMKQLLNQWRGLVVSTHLVCPHCVIVRLKQCFRWSPEVAWAGQLEGKSNVDYVMCPQDLGEDVPTGLIQQVTADNNKQVEVIKDYLKENWVDTVTRSPVTDEVIAHFKTKLPLFQSIMYTDAVIYKLQEKKLISERYRLKLMNMTINSQVENLLKKLILRKTMDDMSVFKQVLEETQYHTNITLAKMIPTPDGIIPKDPEELLTKNELKTIKDKFYKVFYEHIGIEQLIPHFHSAGVLHKSQREIIDNKVTSKAKASFVLDQVLIRGTYDTVLGVRKALLEKRSHHLASLLPARNDDSNMAELEREISNVSELHITENQAAKNQTAKEDKSIRTDGDDNHQASATSRGTNNWFTGEITELSTNDKTKSKFCIIS